MERLAELVIGPVPGYLVIVGSVAGSVAGYAASVIVDWIQRDLRAWWLRHKQRKFMQDVQGQVMRGEIPASGVVEGWEWPGLEQWKPADGDPPAHRYLGVYQVDKDGKAWVRLGGQWWVRDKEADT